MKFKHFTTYNDNKYFWILPYNRKLTYEMGTIIFFKGFYMVDIKSRPGLLVVDRSEIPESISWIFIRVLYCAY